jgi:hypothetical protein
MDRRTTFTASLTLALVMAVAASSLVLARGPGGGPGGGGGGGGGPGGGGGGGGGGETTTSNSLSVPAIMVGGGFTGVTCGTPADPSEVVLPTGTPAYYSPDQSYDGAPPAGHYYVQGVNKWQAQCYTDTTATATADWGDNLTGDARLKVGSPIRVELGLETAGSMDGFTVAKLEPEKLDREADYGTPATTLDGGGFEANPTTFTSVRVYDAGVTFSVQNLESESYVVPAGSNPTAEINATGRIVYGYNLRVSDAGQYRITFVTKWVTLTNADAGTTDTISLDINVVSGGGGRR